MQKEVQHIPWISVTLLLLAVALVGFFFQQPDIGVTGALVYRDYGYGGFGGGGYGGPIFGDGLSITAFYDQYHLYIDAIIFLLIFLGMGKAFLLEHFKSGGKALYIAVGLALTLGLLLWEEREGFSIIYNLGPISIVAILIAFYVWIKKATGSHLWAIGICIGILVLLSQMFAEFSNFFSFIFGDLSAGVRDTIWFYFIGIVILVIILTIKTVKKGP